MDPTRFILCITYLVSSLAMGEVFLFSTLLSSARGSGELKKGSNLNGNEIPAIHFSEGKPLVLECKSPQDTQQIRQFIWYKAIIGNNGFTFDTIGLITYSGHHIEEKWEKRTITLVAPIGKRSSALTFATAKYPTDTGVYQCKILYFGKGTRARGTAKCLFRVHVRPGATTTTTQPPSTNTATTDTLSVIESSGDHTPLFKSKGRWPPKINSTGEITLGEKFVAVCHFTVTSNLTNFLHFPTLTWNCNMSSAVYRHKSNDFAKVLTKGYTITSALTIPRVSCEMDGVVCYCHRLETSDMEKVLATTTMQLTAILTLELTHSIPVIERKETTFTCRGTVWHPGRRLEMYMKRGKGHREVTMTGRQLSAADNVTCSRNVTLTVVIKLTRRHSGYTVVCGVTGTGHISNTLDLSRILEYLVAKARIQFKGFILKRNSTFRIKEGSPYTIRCLAKSNPSPNFTFYFTPKDNDGTGKAKTETTKGDYMRRRAAGSQEGMYYCTARNRLSTGPASMKTSPTLTLVVTNKTWVLVASIAVGIVISAIVIVSAAFYIRRRRSRASRDTGRYWEHYQNSRYEAAYSPDPTDNSSYNSVATDNGAYYSSHRESYDVRSRRVDTPRSILMSRSVSSCSGSRVRDSGSTRTVSSDLGSRRSSRW